MLTITFLPHQLPEFISGHADFDSACWSGAECYMEDYEDFDPRDVRAFVKDNAGRRFNSAEALYGVSSLPCRVGFCLGWLSALACTHPDFAASGLAYLTSLVPVQYQKEIDRGCNPLVEVPGLYQSL